MGVELDVVGITVVFVVLLYPPGLAQANKEIDGEAGHDIETTGSKDGLMAGVVAHKSYLAVSEGQERCDQQLKGEIVQNYQESKTQAESAQGQKDFVGIVGGAAYPAAPAPLLVVLALQTRWVVGPGPGNRNWRF